MDSDKPVLNSEELLAESATEQNLPQMEVLDWTQTDSSSPEKSTAKKLKKGIKVRCCKYCSKPDISSGNVAEILFKQLCVSFISDTLPQL